MEEDNTILRAYRSGKNNPEDSISIDIQKNTFGFELYRIVLMLVNQMLKMNTETEINEENVNKFFDDLKEDYTNFYMKKKE